MVCFGEDVPLCWFPAPEIGKILKSNLPLSTGKVMHAKNVLNTPTSKRDITALVTYCLHAHITANVLSTDK